MIYRVISANMDVLRKKVNTVATKCRKYGCDFRFEEVGEEVREVTFDDGRKANIKFTIVDVEGVARINGWKFIATVNHTDAGNIIKAACEVNIPTKYYTTDPICEHCGYDRRRNDTFLVMNEETGEFKQVGKRCLCDFTNGMSVEAVSAYETIFHSIEVAGDWNDPEWVGHHRDPELFSMDEVLRFAAEIVRKFGYVKKSEYEDNYTTKDRLKNYIAYTYGILGHHQAQEVQKEMESVSFNPDCAEAKDMTQKAIEWLNSQEDNGNYMHNLMVVSKLGYVDFSNFGLVASIFQTYKKAMEREMEERGDVNSSYVGAIGDRLTIAVKTCSLLTSWEGMYGWTGIYKFVDEDGNIFVWKTSSSFETANVHCVTGSVKAHNEFRGVQQTELTRCKVA